MSKKRLCDFCGEEIFSFSGENRLRLEQVDSFNSMFPNNTELAGYSSHYKKDVCDDCREIVKHIFKEGFEEILTALKKQSDSHE